MYVFFIYILHNKHREASLYGPESTDIKYKGISYWILPDFTNDDNILDICKDIIDVLFKIGNEIQPKNISKKLKIRDFSWDKNIKKTTTATKVNTIDKNKNVKKYLTKIYLHLDDDNDNSKSKFKSNCNYHKVFLKDIFTKSAYVNQTRHRKNLDKLYYKKYYKNLKEKKEKNITLNEKEKKHLLKLDKVFLKKGTISLDNI